MNIFTIVRYRWLLQELITRDLKIKYRRSFLGYLWSLLNPLMIMTILTIVFSQVFRFSIPNYPVYLLAGQLIFGFYSEATTMAMHSILGSAALIKKIYLPKYIFPVSRILSCFTTMTFSLAALFIVMFATKSEVHITTVMIPVVLFYVLVFTIGIGLILSVLIVYFRDIQYLYGVFLTALNYLTPIFYPVSILPDWLREVLVFNPLYNYVEMFRKVVLYGVWPGAYDHILCLGIAIVSLVLGLIIFRRCQRDFILFI